MKIQLTKQLSCDIIPLLQIQRRKEDIKTKVTSIFPFSTFNLLISRRSEGGIAPVSGTGDRGFESRRFDQKDKVISQR